MIICFPASAYSLTLVSLVFLSRACHVKLLLFGTNFVVDNDCFDDFPDIVLVGQSLQEIS